MNTTQWKRIVDCSVPGRFLRSGNVDGIGQWHVLLLPRTLPATAAATAPAATTAAATTGRHEQHAQIPQIAQIFGHIRIRMPYPERASGVDAQRSPLQWHLPPRPGWVYQGTAFERYLPPRSEWIHLQIDSAGGTADLCPTASAHRRRRRRGPDVVQLGPALSAHWELLRHYRYHPRNSIMSSLLCFFGWGYLLSISHHILHYILN